MKKVLIFAINFYRNTLALLKMPTCRFYPTCSCYAKKSVEKFGAIKGGVLSLKRILKCNQFHPGGYDPVP